MIPAGAFIPTEDDNDYIEATASHLSVESGVGRFTAPILVPVPVVNIKKITLYAYDNDAADTLCVYMYRAAPGDCRRGKSSGGPSLSRQPRSRRPSRHRRHRTFHGADLEPAKSMVRRA